MQPLILSHLFYFCRTWVIVRRYHKYSLREILNLHLNSWCGNFVERHSFCRVSSDSRFQANSAETVPFHKTSIPRNEVKIWYFTQWLIMIPPWFQAFIYWKKSVIWRHHFQSSIFSMLVSMLVLVYLLKWSICQGHCV